MTDHLSLRDGDLYTCPACEWRAVQTTRGLVITAHGDVRASHHTGYAPSAAERRAWVKRVVTRLRVQYSDGVMLPRCDGRHVYPCETVKTGRCVCQHQDDYRLTLRQLQRLMRCVMVEYENE